MESDYILTNLSRSPQQCLLRRVNSGWRYGSASVLSRVCVSLAFTWTFVKVLLIHLMFMLNSFIAVNRVLHDSLLPDITKEARTLFFFIVNFYIMLVD